MRKSLRNQAPNTCFKAQSTLTESSQACRKNSEVIKSHHNVAGLPKNIKFKKIVEPLRDLYKDEVRKVAKMLGLPKELVNRQPFPGPGLAVRIIGELTPEKVNIAKKADAIVRQEIEKNGLGETSVAVLCSVN